MTRKEIKEFGQHVADKVFHKREQSNTIIIKGWIARDLVGFIYFYREKPTKGDCQWEGNVDGTIDLDTNSFPQVNWGDNKPTPCEIVIKIEK